MEINYICFATLSTGSKIKLTEELYNQFQEASNEDFLTLPNGTTFKKSAVMQIQDIKEWINEQKTFDYHQPYSALPPVSFTDIINSTKRLSAIENMAKGLKKAKVKFDRPTPAIDELLKLARKRYMLVKNNKV